MKIELAELRELCEKLINHQLERGIETIHLKVDYYWNSPAARRYDPYQKPSEFDLGQLSDDWVELRKVLSGEKEMIGYHLVWLANVLSAVGENVTG